MRYPTLFLMIFFACSVCLQTYAQTPDSAVRYYQDAQKKMKKGDWSGALEDYTKSNREELALERLERGRQTVEPPNSI